MATTTPNFGWPVPTSTDLVKDGATAIEGLGDAIDASLLDLKGGTTGQVLAKASNTDMDFTWATDASGIPATIFDAKGDIIAATAADTASRLAVGTNGQILTADSTTATGLKWASAASSSPASAAAYVGANESTTSTSFTALTTAGPAVTLTTGTKAFLILSSRMEGTSTSTRGYMSYAVSGATTIAANEGRAQELKVQADQFIDQHSFGILITGLTAGSNTFTAQYKSQTGAIVYFTERRLAVIDMGS